MKKLLLLLLVLLTGCGHATPREQAEVTPHVEQVLAMPAPQPTPQPEAVELSLYYDKADYSLSLYEPPNGCYLGAYILSNKAIDFSIKNFEAATGKKHQIYVYYMNLGDAFPTNFVLDCLSNYSTPYIVINPGEGQDPFDTSLLEKTAREFGEYYIPVFVDYFPVGKNNGFKPEEYKSLYSKARLAFKAYAPNAAFVYSVAGTRADQAEVFYPGDEMTDWVGISLYREISDKGQPFEGSMFDRLENFYYKFQASKPIVVSELAISHFSSVNHVYYTEAAAEEILSAYETIRENYPRIKCINYMDFNGIEISSKHVGDNFSVTADDEILNSYKSAISNEAYISGLEVYSFKEKLPQIIKFPLPAYKREEAIFVSEAFFNEGLKNNSNSYEVEFINGKRYVSLSTLIKFEGIRADVDLINMKVYLQGLQNR